MKNATMMPMARPPRLIIAEDDENDVSNPLSSSSRRVVVFDALVVFCPILDFEEATNNGAFSEEGKALWTRLDIFTSSFSSKSRSRAKK
jgi:hypothetical protein